MDIEKHFELSEELSEHLMDEINLFSATNGLLPADIIYILNKILVITIHSIGASNADAEKILDLFKTKTLEELVFRNDHE